MSDTKALVDIPSMLDCALSYALRGLQIFPLTPGDKKPLGGHGHLDATTDQELVTRWWESNPNAGIGNRPGENEVVIDVDPRAGGDATFEALVRRLGPLPATVTTVTPGGGSHRRFRIPQGTSLPKKLAEGVDLKGHDGYVVLPPSQHPNRGRYAWAPYGDPEEQAVAELPMAWLQELGKSGTPRTAGVGAPALPLEIHEGQGRDNALTSLAGTLRRRGIDEAEILDHLRVTNAKRCKPPLPEQDLARIAHSVSRYEPAESIPAAGARSTGRSGLALTSLGQLLKEPEEVVRWLVDGLLPAGGLSVVVAKPKAGKSTLARQLSMAVSRGQEFLGRATVRGSVIYLAFEEKKSEVLDHFRRMGVRDDDEIVHVHFGTAPADAIHELRRIVAEIKPALVIVDTLFRMARVKDVNDYAQVTAAMEPLLDIARETEAHVLLVHHAGKNKREGADAVLGSTAIFGAVDTAILLKRSQQHRTVETQQRYGQDLEQAVLLFDPATRTVSLGGSRAGADERRIREEMSQYFQGTSASVDEETILRAVRGDTGLKRRILRDSTAFTRCGTGKKGDPYRYRPFRTDEQTGIGKGVSAGDPAKPQNDRLLSDPSLLDEQTRIENESGPPSQGQLDSCLGEPTDENRGSLLDAPSMPVRDLAGWTATQTVTPSSRCAGFVGENPQALCEDCGSLYWEHGTGPVTVAQAGRQTVRLEGELAS